MNVDDHIAQNRNRFFLVILTEPKYRFYRHLVLILAFAFLYYDIRGTEPEPLMKYTKIITLSFLLLLSYLNMYLLVPKLLFKNKYAEYVLAVLGLIILSILLFAAGRFLFSLYFTNVFNKKFNLPKIIFGGLVIITASTAIKLFQRWLVDTERINELEKLTIQSELAQLKNKINPHFLFNMLNNANVLTQKDPEKASLVLTSLSDLLRYQLYDSARDKVLLTSDIHFLSDLLNLEKIRRDNFEVVISEEGQISGVQVPPLLFVTFVENAVKHSMDAEGTSYVHLYFKVINNELYFKCVNSKPQKQINKNNPGGLGLANIKRTLELLYPGKHLLRIEDKETTYSIILTIQI
jgi:sensor histidine kinase YesM